MVKDSNNSGSTLRISGLCGCHTMDRTCAYCTDPQISDMYIPWLVLFIISAIPCYVILYLGWRVAVNIGKDRSFSLENARHIKLASKIILFDALYFLL